MFSVVRKCPVCDAEFLDKEYTGQASEIVTNLQEDCYNEMEQAEKLSLEIIERGKELDEREKHITDAETNYRNRVKEQFADDIKTYKKLYLLLRQIYSTGLGEDSNLNRTQMSLLNQVENAMIELKAKLKII